MPQRFYCEIEADSPSLPGLAEASLVSALSQMFQLEILKIGDLETCHPQFGGPLTVGFFWSGKDEEHMDLRKEPAFKHLANAEIPLWAFPHSGKDGIERWANAYSDQRDLVPLLLAGRILEVLGFMEQEIGGSEKELAEALEDLWNWRDAPIRHEWLVETRVCKGWAVRGVDLLTAVLEALRVVERAGVVSSAKINDLRDWVEKVRTIRGS